MTGQNAPAKMLVRPLIEKAAEHVARARAAIKVAVVTVTLLWRSTATVGVTGRGTAGVTVRVTVRLRFLAGGAVAVRHWWDRQVVVRLC